MREVRIREAIENIVSAGVLGSKINQPHKYFQLYFVESGEILSNGIYNLRQGGVERVCNITAGEVRGVEWIDRNRSVYII